MPTIDRTLAGDVLHFRLEDEMFQLGRSLAAVRGGRSARTLIKDGPLRMTLIAIAPNSRIPSHHAEGPITIQPVNGRIRLELAHESVDLAVGDVLSLGAGVEHAVSSATGGAFLLTVVAHEDF